MEIMINGKSMKWYNACKIITLVLGIFACIQLAGMLFAMIMLAVIMSVASGDPEFVMMSDFFNQTTFFMGLNIIAFILITVALFVAYHGIKNYKKTAYYMMLALHIGLPLLCLLATLFMPDFIDSYVQFMIMSGDIDFTDYEFMYKFMLYLMNGVYIIYALVFGCALIPNTIYFNKRKDLLN